MDDRVDNGLWETAHGSSREYHISSWMLRKLGVLKESGVRTQFCVIYIYLYLSFSIFLPISDRPCNVARLRAVKATIEPDINSRVAQLRLI